MSQGFVNPQTLSSPISVSDGGTGNQTATAYTVQCGGTTATGPFQSAGIGTAGQILTSNGAGALPTFQTLGTQANQATSTTRSAGATYALTSSSTYYQIYNGANFGAIDTVTLPDTSTLSIGRQFYIVNTNATGNLSVKTFGAVEIAQISSSRLPLICTCVSTSVNTAAAWACEPLGTAWYSFTPTVSFATPGDLSVTYNNQSGSAIRMGNLLYISLNVRFTPTYTTASGRLQVSGFPIYFQGATSTGYNGVLGANGITGGVVTPFAYPAGCTQVFPSFINGSVMTLKGVGSSTVTTELSTTQFPTASERSFDVTVVGPAVFI